MSFFSDTLATANEQELSASYELWKRFDEMLMDESVKDNELIMAYYRACKAVREGMCDKVWKKARIDFNEDFMQGCGRCGFYDICYSKCQLAINEMIHGMLEGKKRYQIESALLTERNEVCDRWFKDGFGK
jgi:hypothetical protein